MGNIQSTLSIFRMLPPGSELTLVYQFVSSVSGNQAKCKCGKASDN
jgi:hypothetical protein